MADGEENDMELTKEQSDAIQKYAKDWCAGDEVSHELLEKIRERVVANVFEFLLRDDPPEVWFKPSGDFEITVLWGPLSFKIKKSEMSNQDGGESGELEGTATVGFDGRS